jgi:hypothetical protein
MVPQTILEVDEHPLKRELCGGCMRRGPRHSRFSRDGILSLLVYRSWAIELTMIAGVECLGAEVQGRPQTPLCGHRTAGARPRFHDLNFGFVAE